MSRLTKGTHTARAASTPNTSDRVSALGHFAAAAGVFEAIGTVLNPNDVAPSVMLPAREHVTAKITR